MGAKVMMEGFGKDMMGGIDQVAPRSNPVCLLGSAFGSPSLGLTDWLQIIPEQVQPTALADLKDPIQVHLLTEIALSDSREYQIITQEVVDVLKKQCMSMNERVELTRSNLAIQCKYRDAAISMAKLYAAEQASGNGNLDQSAKEAEMERQAAERTCDDLARELFNLEKALLSPQRQLLEHTAGILQLTHKASKRRMGPPTGQLNNGIPGSPESLYTYSNSRNSMDYPGDDNYSDDPSLYQLDSFEGLQTKQQRKNAIEIPLKSPIREQTNQLRGEMDRLREENTQLIKSLSLMGQNLQSLNGSLRDTIIRFNPAVNSDYLAPPTITTDQSSSPIDVFKVQIDYMESALVAVQAEQESFTSPSPIPETNENNRQTETVLEGLWDIIQSGFADKKKQKEDRRKHRADKGLLQDDDTSDDDGLDTSELYSLAGFSTRVQWLYSQATTLKDQKSVLKRQIKQQRELNNKTDAEKDEEIERRQQELEQARQLLDRAEKDAMDAQTMLSTTLQDLESAREAAGSAQSARVEVQECKAKIRSLESELAGIESRTRGASEKYAGLDLKLDEASRRTAAAEAMVDGLQAELEDRKADLAFKEKEVQQKEGEIDNLSMTLAELKTEVTIARAELDGAYGSRAERAADVAALKNDSDILKLSNQVERLKKELAGTVQDLESITKETIGAEREKLELEHKLDEALSAVISLETEVQKSRDQISKLQDELDSERLKVAPAQGSSSRLGASMLSDQFRATMREERKKFQEDIRVRVDNLHRWYWVESKLMLIIQTGGTIEVPKTRRGASSNEAQPRAGQESIESSVIRAAIYPHIPFSPSHTNLLGCATSLAYIHIRYHPHSVSLFSCSFFVYYKGPSFAFMLLLFYLLH